MRYSTLSSIREQVFMYDWAQPLDDFSYFALVCPEGFFLSFQQLITECLVKKYQKNTRYQPSFAELIEFFRCEIIMMSMEIFSATLEGRVVRDDYMQYKRVCDIMTKAEFAASIRDVSTGVALIPTFTMDPILSDFILSLNRLWSRLFLSWCIKGILR